MPTEVITKTTKKPTNDKKQKLLVLQDKPTETSVKNKLTLEFPTVSCFTTETFKEIINWNIVIKALMSTEVLRVVKIKNKFGRTFEFENERQQIIELLKKGCKSSRTREEIDDAVKANTLNSVLQKLYSHQSTYLNEEISVKYYYDRRKALGRVYPEGSLSLCSLRRSIRHILAVNKYLDIDIVNCHFKIADELLNKDAIKFPNLHYYTINRKHYLQKLCDYINNSLEGHSNDKWDIIKNYDDLKECFLRILYFGTFQTWCDDMGLPPLPIPDFIKEFITEFLSIAELVKQNNPELVKLLEDKNNPNGSIVSWFLQEWERRILEILYKYLIKKKQISKNKCVLCFDGIMILSNDKNKDKSFLDKLLKDASVFIKTETGIEVEFKDKPFDNLEYLKILEKISVEFQEDTTLFIENKDDNEASKIIYEKVIKNDLVYCNGSYYLKVDNKWINNFKEIQSKLLYIVLNSSIYYQNDKGHIKCYAQSVSNAKNIVIAILTIPLNSPKNDLYYKFHSTTRGKICFKDGVLSLQEKWFKEWNDPYFKEEKNKIYTTIIIERNFKEIWNTRNDDKWTKIKNDIRENLFEKILKEQSTKMLQQLYRAICGFIEDKDWGLWLGERNCGKGCINELLMTACEKYIYNLPSNCLIKSKFTSKDTKQNSWKIDLQFVRLTFVQEFQKDEEDMSGIKVDGIEIKSICSGGDPQLARKNFQDETSFIIGSKLMIMCNDIPKIEPQDCLSTCIQYNSGISFKSQEYIDNRRKELKDQIKEEKDQDIKNSVLKEMETYLVADDTIKSKCRSDDWCNGFLLLLMDNAIENKLEPSNDSDLKEDNNIDNVINENFVFIPCFDMVSNTDLKEIWRKSKTGISFQKFKTKLIVRGCADKRNGSQRGLCNLVVKKIEEQVKDCLLIDN
jgi:hypothetical protein